jgi:hypothetical protein
VVVRVVGVRKLVAVVNVDLPVGLVVSLAYGVSVKSLVFVLVVRAAASAAGLLDEWQRRKTLIALVKAASPGTVVGQGNGCSGLAIRAGVGCGPRDPVNRCGG